MDKDAIIRWLNAGGAIEDIFGPTAGGIPFLDEDTQDYINDRGTWQKKANDLMSDQATFAQIGPAPGGVRPEDFQPNVTYEAVKAPAYLRLQQMKNSTDPMSRLVATTFLNGGTALEAESAVLTAIQNGEFPAPAAMVSNRPGQVGSMDTERLQKMTSDLETMVLNDPAFSALDPKTGMPANTVDEEGNPIIFNQETGSFERKISTPTPTMEYFDEMNLSNPFDPYPSDIFAGEGDLAREAKTYRDEEEAINRYLLADAARQADVSDSFVDTAIDDPLGLRTSTMKSDLSNENVMKAYQSILNEESDLLSQMAQQTNPDAPSLFGETLAPGVREAGAVGEGRTSGRTDSRPLSTTKTMFGGKGDWVKGAMTRYGDTDDKRRLARARAGVSLPAEALRARQASSNAQIKAGWSDFEDFQRKQFARKLSQAGYNPYFEEIRGRQGQVYGG